MFSFGSRFWGKAAAERGFFRALKELRLLQAQPKAEAPGMDAEAFRAMLASFSPFEKLDAEFDAMYPREAPMPPSNARNRFEPASLAPVGGVVDVPFSIGKRQ